MASDGFSDAIGEGEDLTLRVAQLLGREFIVRVFVRAGMQPSEAENSAQEVLRAAAAALDPAEPSVPVRRALAQAVGETLERLTAHDDETAALVEEAFRIAAENVSMRGFGTRLAAITASLVLLLVVAKMEGRYEWTTGEGYVALEAGVPEGFSEVIRALSEGVRSALPTSAPRLLPRPGAPRLSLPSVRSSRPGASPPSLSGRPSVAPLNVPTADPAEARAQASAVLDHVRSSATLSAILDPLLEPRPGADADTARPSGDEGDARGRVAFGAALLPLGREGFSIALRIQTPRRPKPNVLKAVEAVLARELGTVVPVRWTAPIRLGGSNPAGTWRPWKVGRSPFRIGSPVNVAGGAVSSVGLFVQADRRFYAIVAGHAISDGATPTTGQEVFWHPQPLPPDRSASIGTLEDLHRPPCRALGRSPHLRIVDRSTSGNRSTPDFGLVLLHPGNVPPVELRTKVGQKSFSKVPHSFDVALDLGLRIMKSAGRTAEAHGTVTSTDAQVEAQDPLRSCAVRLDGMIEVEFDRIDRFAPGDSGSLVCVDSDGTLKPLGICIAGAERSRIRQTEELTRSVAYVLPLATILAQIGPYEVG